MSLSSGSRLGPYEIVSLVGSGGMGDVYRARDSRLGRDVAIKVLPDTFAADPDRLRRFEHEARAAGTLNHPNILAVYDIGRHEDAPYIVSELLEGETLRSRLTGGAIPIRKAMEYALQIARGLSAAHDKAIVHRDLKPENVFLTRDDRVKILDFGLAKAVPATPPDGDSSVVAPTGATDIGTILGTVGYMAPEQVRGLPVDHRADVFAFGCVLYEMLSGRRAFSGATSADAMTAILTNEPPEIAPATASVPHGVDRIVRRCLEKAPDLRFQSARDLAFAIENATGAGSATSGPQALVAAPAMAGSRRARAVRLAVALVAGVAIGAAGMAWVASRRAPAAALSFGRIVAITHEAGLELNPDLSPDGAFVAYASGPSDQTHIYVRQVAGGRAIDLTPSLTGNHARPRWSPDGTRILFSGEPDTTPGSLDSAGSIYIVPALGGVARRVVDRAHSGEWSPDGSEIAYVSGGRVWVRGVDGGAPRAVTDAIDAHSLAWSPDRRRLAFVSGNPGFTYPGRMVGNGSPSTIMLVRAEGGAAVAVTGATVLNMSPVWTTDSRRLLFVSNAQGTRDVYEQAITVDGRAAGDPRRLTTGLNAHTIALSRDGRRVAYATLSVSANVWSITIPGRPPVSIREATQVTTGTQSVEGMGVSRDGAWLAFDSNRAGNQDIYRMRLPNGEPEQVTTDPSDEFAPAFSPDSAQIVFHAFPAGNRDLYAIGADGQGRQRLTSLPGQEWFADWSPDGARIAFTDGNTRGLSVIKRNGNTWSAPVPITTDGAARPGFSPDGRWLMGVLFGQGERGVLKVIPSEGGAARTLWRGALPGTTALVAWARWSPDGRVVYIHGIDRQGRSSFWSIPAEGGSPTLIVRFDEPTRESNRPEFATDGTRLYFSLAQKGADVWVMDVERR